MTAYGVTGANGFVGSRIVRELRAAGHDVRELTRHTMPRFALGEPADPALLAGTEVLVHCAYDFRPKDWAGIKRSNVAGTLALFDAAREAGVQRVIFISSMSAFEGCKSMYGRAKLAVERRAADHHPAVVCVRPGLVYDEQSGGIVGAMRGVMRRLPVVPLIGARQEFYMCHAADLARAIIELSEGPLPDGPVVAAEPVPRTFQSILATMAEADGRHPRFVAVPHQLAFWGLRTLEALHIPTRLRSDSITGLVNNDPSPHFGGLQTTFRAFTPDAVRSSAVNE